MYNNNPGDNNYGYGTQQNPNGYYGGGYYNGGYGPQGANQPNNNNTYNYNFYSMFGGHDPIVDKEAADIRKYGMRAGTAILVAMLLQNITAVVFRSLGLLENYMTDANNMNGINVFIQCIYLFIPFLVAFLTSHKKDRRKILIFNAPKSKELYVFAVFAGLMICSVASFAGSILIGVFSALGVDFISGAEDIPMPDSIPGYILMAISVAVVPALLEEFAFRGVLLQPLRKHGDAFAIVVTSIVFAFMHGNMVQMPFAFVAGLALGYFCIATDSIWTSITIHFLNNLTSVIMSLYYDKFPDASNIAYYIISGAILVIGIIALILFAKNNDFKLRKKTSQIAPSMKRALYLCTPTLTASFIYFFFSTLNLQTTSSSLGSLVLLALLIAFSIYFMKSIYTIRHDRRLASTNPYGVSLAFSVLWAVVGTILIFVYALIK